MDIYKLLKEAYDALGWYDDLWTDVNSFSCTVEHRGAKKTISGFPFLDENASEFLHSEAVGLREEIEKFMEEAPTTNYEIDMFIKAVRKSLVARDTEQTLAADHNDAE